MANNALSKFLLKSPSSTTAGPDLGHLFDTLKRKILIPKPDKRWDASEYIQRYLDGCAEYFAKVDKLCREYPTRYKPHRRSHKLRLLQRYLIHLQAGKGCFQLAAMPWQWTMYRSRMLEGSRIRVAARVAWLQMRVANGEDPYPARGRYESYLEGLIDEMCPRDVDLDSLRSKLDDRHKWLLDFDYQPSLDWQVFLILVSELTIVEIKFPGPTPPFEEWNIQDCTVEAMESEEPECSICTSAYGPSHPTEKATEPAVKMTPCGHIIGAHCLRTWSTSSITCPICRTTLVELPITLTTEATGIYSKLCEIFGLIQLCDRVLDDTLLRGPREFEPEAFHELMNRMQKWLVHHASGWIAARVANQEREWVDFAKEMPRHEEAVERDDVVVRWSVVKPRSRVLRMRHDEEGEAWLAIF